MIYAARRNSDRCPTHPGALLREDVIPATGIRVSMTNGGSALSGPTARPARSTSRLSITTRTWHVPRFTPASILPKS